MDDLPLLMWTCRAGGCINMKKVFKNITFLLVFILATCTFFDPLSNKESKDQGSKECKERTTYLLWMILLQQQCDKSNTGECFPYQWGISNVEYLCSGDGSDMGM